MKKRIQIGLLTDYTSDFGRAIYRGCLAYSRTQSDVQIHRMTPIAKDDDRIRWSRIPDLLIGQFHTQQQIERLQKKGRSLVNISGRIREPGIPTIRIDDWAVGRLAAEYFLGRGFRHFAFKGFDTLAFSQNRWRGYEETLTQQDLYPVESIHELKGDIYSLEALSYLPTPCAVFCATDYIGARVIQTCIAREIDVPESLSVLGVDNDEFLSEGLQIPLSSIDVGAPKIGYEAAKWIHQHPEPVRAPPTFEQKPVGVVERRSSDLMAVEDALVGEVLRRIRSRHRDPVKVPDLLKGLPIQRRMLERRFKQETGRSVHQELRRLRMESAKDLLANSDFTVEEIAESTAIGESRQLSAMFKKELGMTPTAWRNQFEFR